MSKKTTTSKGDRSADAELQDSPDSPSSSEAESSSLSSSSSAASEDENNSAQEEETEPDLTGPIAQSNQGTGDVQHLKQSQANGTKRKSPHDSDGESSNSQENNGSSSTTDSDSQEPSSDENHKNPKVNGASGSSPGPDPGHGGNEQERKGKQNQLDFETMYLRTVTKQYASDLEKLRTTARDFKDSSVPVLIRALRQGAELFGEDEKKTLMER